MPVTEETMLHISCDNPACPGNNIPPNSRDGWLFVSAEVYGDPSTSHVFCSADCLSAASGAAEAPAIFAEPPA